MGKIVDFQKRKQEQERSAKQEPIMGKAKNDSVKVTLNAEEIHVLLMNYLSTIMSILEDYKENPADFQGINLEDTKTQVKHHLNMIRKLMNRYTAIHPCLDMTMQWSMENLLQSWLILCLSDGLWEMEFGDYHKLEQQQKWEVHLYYRLKTLYDKRTDSTQLNPFLEYGNDDTPESIQQDLKRMEQNLFNNEKKYSQDFQQKVVLLEEAYPYIENQKGSKQYYVKEYPKEFDTWLQRLLELGVARYWSEEDTKREESLFPKGWRLEVKDYVPVPSLLLLGKEQLEVATWKEQEKLLNDHRKQVAKMDGAVHRIIEKCRKAGF